MGTEEVTVSRVLIIGFGTVGQELRFTFEEATIHDPEYHFDAPKADGDEPIYDVGFICVPTEMLEDGNADTSIVEAVVSEWLDSCEVLCIKSTVPPGFTQELIDRGHPVVMSPEYYGATVHAQSVMQDFVILGGLDQDCRHVAEVYKEVMPGSFRIHYTTATTAELVKYGENAWLATKVAFVNEFARICGTFEVNPDVWRQLWLLDARINPSHTWAYRNKPYFDSHCLNKDVPAIIAASLDAGYYPSILESVRRQNEKWIEAMEDLW